MPNSFEFFDSPKPKEVFVGKASPTHAIFYNEETNEYVSFETMFQRGWLVEGYDLTAKGLIITWGRIKEE